MTLCHYHIYLPWYTEPVNTPVAPSIRYLNTTLALPLSLYHFLDPPDPSAATARVAGQWQDISRPGLEVADVELPALLISLPGASGGQREGELERSPSSGELNTE